MDEEGKLIVWTVIINMHNSGGAKKEIAKSELGMASWGQVKLVNSKTIEASSLVKK